MVKPPEIPTWSKSEDYEIFQGRLKAWVNESQETERIKFNRITESLKKSNSKDGLEDFIVKDIYGKLKKPEDQTTENLIDLLNEKFAKTKETKYDEFVMKLRNLKANDAESLWKEIERMETDWDELEVDKNGKFFLWRMLAVLGTESGILRNDEVIFLNRDIKHLADVSIMERLKVSYKEIKLTSISKDASNTFYGNYDNKNSQSSRSRSPFKSNNYDRSKSPYKKDSSKYSRSRSPYNKDGSKSGGDRNGSRTRFTKIEDRIEKLEKQNDTLVKQNNEILEVLKNQVIVKNAKFCHTYGETKTYFAEENTGLNHLLLDTGAPRSLVGKECLDRHLEE